MVAPTGKTYSDIAGLTTGRSGVAKRINQRRVGELTSGGGDTADFKISDMDESGNRTLRSLSGAQGVRSKTSEVMYLTAQRGDSSAMSDISTSRPAVYEVFGGQSRGNLYKAKSESDLLDSGVDSYFGDEEEDEDNMGGIFNRPGFGKTAFLTGNNFLNTLHSFEGQVDGSDHSMDNGLPSAAVNGYDDGGDDSDDVLGEEGNKMVRGPKDLPWDQEEVDTLDDDEEGTTTSALETFLWSVQLEGYLHKFLQEKVDMELLVKMSDKDLQEIGLPFGPRKRLLAAIKRRHEVLSLPKYISDSFLWTAP